MMKEAWVFVIGFMLVVLSGCDIESRLLYYPGEITIADVQQYAADNALQM